ncbi:hypothetical protein F5878DRAFT_647451 [Lentinula raphanica]|uniref:Uncharacterized protein n=1 Tax=Lentinula raphanica TaxID=153919 RepID=A0AA38NW00_9AGAR|nr:hypothetical protein F5878DRAFT_647451 [Lentinula raphanica]
MSSYFYGQYFVSFLTVLPPLPDRALEVCFPSSLFPSLPHSLWTWTTQERYQGHGRGRRECEDKREDRSEDMSEDRGMWMTTRKLNTATSGHQHGKMGWKTPREMNKDQGDETTRRRRTTERGIRGSADESEELLASRIDFGDHDDTRPKLYHNEDRWMNRVTTGTNTTRGRNCETENKRDAMITGSQCILVVSTFGVRGNRDDDLTTRSRGSELGGAGTTMTSGDTKVMNNKVVAGTEDLVIRQFEERCGRLRGIDAKQHGDGEPLKIQDQRERGTRVENERKR